MPRPSRSAPVAETAPTPELVPGGRVRANERFYGYRPRMRAGDAGTVDRPSGLSSDDRGFTVAWDRPEAGYCRVDPSEVTPFTLADWVAENQDLRHQIGVLAGQQHIVAGSRVVFIGESTLEQGGYLDQYHSTGRVLGEGSDGVLSVRWDRYDADVTARRQDLAMEAAWFGADAAPTAPSLQLEPGTVEPNLFDPVEPVSAGILDEARATIAGPRQAAYGSATDSFTAIGRHWEIILGVPVSAAQVAQAMIAFKLVRLGRSPTHRDSWVDIAGYSGLGAEAALNGQEAGA
ncbi:DUF6378 domain-containing protein [Pseudoclavibacter sp. VKM Ac-2888]|uniref:DUF6378 domain-containing protein n=1 Tax=Pseudoclavibacter sp. VKM Ac-2888 TaxID=2783830 RepID=UPI00188B011E|nr:DUF6378 domain-containing protein [Pseudoclavibacter sp. VKM Ac-2888]MBF4549401.1 hypothetical protein [Pseudoclavibacter sp. VKM Ac-2888]